MAVTRAQPIVTSNAGPGRHVRLLAVDPELGANLSADEAAQVRSEVIVPAIDLDRGSFTVDELPHGAEICGFLVLDGLLLLTLTIAGRRCARIVGKDAVFMFDSPAGDSIPAETAWSVLGSARLALFDERLMTLCGRWPGLLRALLSRAARQSRQAFMQQAISQLPRVEERLLALFWSLADHYGVVRPDGVWLNLPATHDVLSHMVGARRPTVSVGLARLADDGLLRTRDGGWLLAPASLNLFTLETDV